MITGTRDGVLESADVRGGRERGPSHDDGDRAGRFRVERRHPPIRCHAGHDDDRAARRLDAVRAERKFGECLSKPPGRSLHIGHRAPAISSAAASASVSA